jgi:tetratricopeptide (TPR) repeat protein
MALLDEAIELNNAARLRFSDGDVEASLAMIQRAVMMARSLHSSLPLSDDTTVSCLDVAIFSFASASLPETLSKAQDFYVYDQLLIISPALGAQSFVVDTHVPTVCAILLFNLAIAYHHYGNFAHRSLIRNKASRLYDLLLHLADSCTANGSDAGKVALWKCLILNNRAHLYYEQGMHGESKTLLDAMSKLLAKQACIECYMDMYIVMEMKLNIWQNPLTASTA